MTGFIAIHTGAGCQNPLKQEVYKKICENAIKNVLQKLRNGCSALDAVTEAIIILEDAPQTNAGKGSNLTLNGEVECDASLMEGHTLDWASVGAISGVKNPIDAARKLLNKQQNDHNDLGLVIPVSLVGSGATSWALQQGCTSASDLITDRTLHAYDKYKAMLEKSSFDNNKRPNQQNVDNTEKVLKKSRLDTVGAIAVDQHGNVASGVSSGGVILKTPGRIGQAAAYGCGCWAEDNVAVSTSGVGEQLIKTRLAEKCANRLLQSSSEEDCIMLGEAVRKSMEKDFIKSKFLTNSSIAPQAGLVALVHSKEEKRTEFFWTHNTTTLCIAYASLKSHDIKFLLSQKSPKDSLLVQSVLL